ncbi:hypothetical protein [Devriesea agamarum]|uniref:hypothetical protein n=1 Tax=Devriesea agamarum TaxID=472569 RepID=UPI00071DA924|nr:hypothetical protein [Devriesea agamarum]
MLSTRPRGSPTRVRDLVVVVFLLALTVLYAWALAWIAYGFLRAGGVVGWGLAAAVTAFLALTIWVTWREVRFGMQAAALMRRLADEGGLPPEPDRTSNGRIDKAAAEEVFAARREETLADDTDWRRWLRLALAYDAAGDRREARASVRRAVRCARENRGETRG